jgi:hypothetical protein
LSTAAPAGCPSPTGAGGMSAALASVAAITNTVEITHRDGPCHPLYPHTDRPRMAPGGVPKQRTHRRRCDQFAICVLQSAHDRPGLAAAAAACPSRLLTSNPLGLNASWPRSHKRHGGSAAEHRTGRPRPPTPCGSCARRDSFNRHHLCSDLRKKITTSPGVARHGLLWGDVRTCETNKRSKQLPFREDIFRTTAPGTTQHTRYDRSRLHKHPDFENDARRKMTKTNNYFYIQQLVGTTVSLEVCF